MSQILAEMVILILDDKNLGLLRITDTNRIIMHFCFSQVSVYECLLDHQRDGASITKQGIETFLAPFYSSPLPHFDALDPISFDEPTSLILSSGFDSLQVLLKDQKALRDKYIDYKTNGLYTYWFPGIDKSNPNAIPMDFPALYMCANPLEVGIFHNKIDAGKLVTKIPGKKIKQCIGRANLPNNSIDSAEWIEGYGAEAFAFLFWITK